MSDTISLNQCDCNFCRTGERDGYGHDDAPRAILVLGGWHGIAEYPIVVVGETPKKWRIEALEYTRLAGRNRAIRRGETALVPKHAVRWPSWTLRTSHRLVRPGEGRSMNRTL